MVQAKPTTPVLNTGDPLYPYVICALPLMDATGTTAHDLSGLGYNATLTGGATFVVDSTLGTVVQLDGSTGYLTLASNLNTALLASQNGVSVSMWLKLRNNQPTVATKTGLMTIQAVNTGAAASKWPAGGTVAGETNGEGYISTFRDGLGRVSNINLGVTDKSQWHHLVITAQAGGFWNIYLNGTALVTINSVTSDNPIGATLTALMGQSVADSNGGPYYLDGWVGDFRAYSLALIQPQVQSLYNSPWNLYTITAPLSQDRLTALMVDGSLYRQKSAERLAAVMIDGVPGQMGSGVTERMNSLVIDAQFYHDPGASPLPPNDPGVFALNQANALLPTLKPTSSTAPTLNADAINSGSVLALPINEAPGTQAGVSLAQTTGGTLTTATYYYNYSFVSPFGESDFAGTVSTSITLTGTNQTVDISNIAVGPAGTTARNIYRATTNAYGSFQLIGTINDNTTTVFTDGGLAAGAFGPFSINDRSGNGNNGFFFGSMSWDTTISSFYYPNRIKAYALKFPSGGNGAAYLHIPRSASLEPASAFTISAWVRPAAFPSTGSAAIISKMSHGNTNNSYYLGVTNGGQFTFYLTDVNDAGVGQTINGGAYPNSLAAGAYFVAATYDGALQKLYVNGILVNSTGDTGNVDYTTPGDLYIGGSPANGTFNGDIDEVRIWNRALSATEIANMWGAQHAVSGVTATIPSTDPGSGAYGAFSNGGVVNVAALLIDATYQKPATDRMTALVLDLKPGTNSSTTSRMVALSIDMNPYVTNVTFLGPWSSTTAYAVGAIVVYNSQDYVCIVANTGQTPTNTTYWGPYSVISMGIASCTPNYGTFNGGTVVQINGQFFRNVTAVYIGGVLCPSWTVLNDSTIQATTAAHAAGYASVRVDSSSYGTVIADRLFQYVGGLVTGTGALFRGKQFSTAMWHQDPPGSFYTGMTASLATDTILPFTLSDAPTTPFSVEVYVRHAGDTGYSRMRYLVDWDVNLANQQITWKSTAAFALVSTDEMIVCYLGQH